MNVDLEGMKLNRLHAIGIMVATGPGQTVLMEHVVNMKQDILILIYNIGMHKSLLKYKITA